MKKDSIEKHLTETACYAFFGPCHFAAGYVKHPIKAGFPSVDTIYFEMYKKSAGMTRFAVMPQEAQALAAALNDALFKLKAYEGWKEFRRKHQKKAGMAR